jgi:hypothetical protein
VACLVLCLSCASLATDNGASNQDKDDPNNCAAEIGEERRAAAEDAAVQHWTAEMGRANGDVRQPNRVLSGPTITGGGGSRQQQEGVGAAATGGG